MVIIRNISEQNYFMSPLDYNMYRGRTMNTLLTEMEGVIEND